MDPGTWNKLECRYIHILDIMRWEMSVSPVTLIKSPSPREIPPVPGKHSSPDFVTLGGKDGLLGLATPGKEVFVTSQGFELHDTTLYDSSMRLETAFTLTATATTSV